MKLDENLKLHLKHKLFGLLSLTSLHGLPNLAKTKSSKVIRFIWLFAFLWSTAISSYLIVQAFLDYFNYDTLIKIDIFNGTETDFPAVTVCNLNPFLKDKTMKIVNDLLVQNNITDVVKSAILDQNAGLFLNQHTTFSKFLVQANLLNGNTTKEFLESLGVSLDEMIISCTYNASEKCSRDDFDWFYTFDYGNCYIFNGASSTSDQSKLVELRKAQRIGKFYGLSMELFTSTPKSIKALAVTSGAHVFINDPTTIPIRAEGLDIKPGYETNIAITKKFRYIILLELYKKKQK